MIYDLARSNWFASGFARRVNAYSSSVSPTRNTTKEGKSLNNAAALCCSAILLSLYTGRSLARASRRVASHRVHVAVNPTVRETTPKHEITLRNAVVGLQLFCFKDPRRACLREMVYTCAPAPRRLRQFTTSFQRNKGSVVSGNVIIRSIL